MSERFFLGRRSLSIAGFRTQRMLDQHLPSGRLAQNPSNVRFLPYPLVFCAPSQGCALASESRPGRETPPVAIEKDPGCAPGLAHLEQRPSLRHGYPRLRVSRHDQSSRGCEQVHPGSFVKAGPLRLWLSAPRLVFLVEAGLWTPWIGPGSPHPCKRPRETSRGPHGLVVPPQLLCRNRILIPPAPVEFRRRRFYFPVPLR